MFFVIKFHVSVGLVLLLKYIYHTMRLRVSIGPQCSWLVVKVTKQVGPSDETVKPRSRVPGVTR